MFKKNLDFKKSHKILFLFFKDWNFAPFQGPQQPNFTPFRGPRQPNFTPFRGPRQLLWNLLEGWGNAGALPKVLLPKLRNTGTPSTNWGALLCCILYTEHCKLYTVHCTMYTVHCTTYNVQFSHQWFQTIFQTIFPTIFSHNLRTQFFPPIFLTQCVNPICPHIFFPLNLFKLFSKLFHHKILFQICHNYSINLFHSFLHQFFTNTFPPNISTQFFHLTC